jgi:hypothetical protein
MKEFPGFLERMLQCKRVLPLDGARASAVQAAFLGHGKSSRKQFDR